MVVRSCTDGAEVPCRAASRPRQVEGDPTGRAPAGVEPDPAWRGGVQPADRDRAGGADIGADAAPSAVVRGEAIGLRLDPNDLVGAETDTGVAAGAALGLDPRGVKPQSAAGRARDQSARRGAGRPTATDPLCELARRLGGGREDAAQKTAPAECRRLVSFTGSLQANHPRLRLERDDLQGIETPIPKQCLDLRERGLDAGDSSARTAIAVATAEHETPHARLVQPQKYAHPQDVQTRQEPLRGRSAIRPDAGEDTGSEGVAATLELVMDRHKGLRDGLFGAGGRAETTAVAAGRIETQPLIVQQPSAVGASIHAGMAAGLLQVRVDAPGRIQFRERQIWRFGPPGMECHWGRGATSRVPPAESGRRPARGAGRGRVPATSPARSALRALPGVGGESRGDRR